VLISRGFVLCSVYRREKEREHIARATTVRRARVRGSHLCGARLPLALPFFGCLRDSARYEYIGYRQRLPIVREWTPIPANHIGFFFRSAKSESKRHRGVVGASLLALSFFLTAHVPASRRGGGVFAKRKAVDVIAVVISSSCCFSDEQCDGGSRVRSTSIFASRSGVIQGEKRKRNSAYCVRREYTGGKSCVVREQRRKREKKRLRCD